MTQGEANRILKTGGMSKKIMLFMEDTALFNTTGSNALEFSNRKYLTKRNFLTQQEKNEIWESVESEKDIELLNIFTSTNKSFTIMKPYIEGYFTEVIHLSTQFIREIENITIKRILSKSINDILNLCPDKEEPLNVLIKNNTCKSKYINSTVLKEDKYFALKSENDEKVINDLTIKLNAKKENLKYLILVTKNVLTKYLPLTSYFEYLEDMENLIYEKENDILEVLKNRKDIFKALSLDLSIKKIPIDQYKDVLIVVTNEDIEDFRKKG